MDLSCVSLHKIGDPGAIWEALGEMLERPEWQRQGLCRVYPDVNWYPERGESTVAAKAICARCPVQAQCLEYALARREHNGVWGGTSDRERRRIGKVVSMSGRAAAPAE